MFERVNIVGCPDGLRDGVPDDWSTMVMSSLCNFTHLIT